MTPPLRSPKWWIASWTHHSSADQDKSWLLMLLFKPYLSDLNLDSIALDVVYSWLAVLFLTPS